jgi:hypothetical protein
MRIYGYSKENMQATRSRTDKEAQEAISKLTFIVGDWSGTGWMMGRDGQKPAFNQTENISFKHEKLPF